MAPTFGDKPVQVVLALPPSVLQVLLVRSDDGISRTCVITLDLLEELDGLHLPLDLLLDEFRNNIGRFLLKIPVQILSLQMAEEVGDQVVKVLDLITHDFLRGLKFLDIHESRQFAFDFFHFVIVVLDLEFAEDLDDSRVGDELVEFLQQGVERVGNVLRRFDNLPQLDFLDFLEAHVLEVFV